MPTVSLHHLHPVCKTHFCHIKLESCNPGGSIKEKNAVYLVDHAEAQGLLRPGSTIIESSSGNFGIGLAIVGAARGYRVIIVVDAKTAAPMRRTLLAYGAELVDVPLHEADASGSMQKARMQKAQELSEQIPNAWYPCQHLNPVNTEAHAFYTAKEIEATFGNDLDAVVVGVSTAGQIMGIAKYLKQQSPHLKVAGVDVEGSVIMGTPAKPYKQNWLINFATLIGVGIMLLLCGLFIRAGMPGAQAAAWAMLLGAFLEVTILAIAYQQRFTQMRVQESEH